MAHSCRWGVTQSDIMDSKSIMCLVDLSYTSLSLSNLCYNGNYNKDWTKTQEFKLPRMKKLMRWGRQKY